MASSFLLRFSSVAVLASAGLTAVACSNISLGSGGGSVNGQNAGAAIPYADVDAAADGGAVAIVGSTAAPSTTDGAAPVLVGSPLCNYTFAGASNSASRTCLPDDSSACEPDDGGSTNGVTGAKPAPVGTEADGGDAGDEIVAAQRSACHVVREGSGEAGTDDGGTVAVVQACTVAGSGKDGDECQTAVDCAADYECVGTPGRCRHYCCRGNSVCADTYAPSFCNPQTVTSGAYRVPVCVPVMGCALFGSCPAGQTCAVVTDNGTTSCVDIGAARAGEPCDELNCAAGLTCLGSIGSQVCYQLCHVDSTTECAPGKACTGSATLFTDPQFGICQ